MNKTITLIFSACIIGIAMLTLSNSGGVALMQGLDRTGAPNSSANCNACHGGGNFNASLNLQVLDAQANPISSYTPDETYTVKVAVNGSNAKVFGMQMVALLSGETNAGSLTALGNNTRTVQLNNKTYGEHNSAATGNTFEYSWKAPKAGSGVVTIYATGIAANDNDGITGDQAASRINVELNESTSTSLQALNSPLVRAFPNPFSQMLTVKLTGIDEAFTIVDINGKLIFSSANMGLESDITTTNWPAGIYLLKTSSATLRIVKL